MALDTCYGIKKDKQSELNRLKGNNMKILHFADVHARDRDIEEIEKCLNFIVETARAEHVDIIINAGDTFDSAGIKADSFSAKLIFRIFKELADIAPVVVIIGTPSHDGQAAETLRYIKAKHPVHVATFPEQLYFGGADGAGILVAMCPAPTKQFWEYNRSAIKTSDVDIASEMSKMFAGFAAQAESDEDTPHVLVGHWNITGSLISETQTLTGVDIELSKEQMALSNADICLMGHIHKEQKLEPNLFYSGSIVPLTWGELDIKGFYIHTLEGKNLIESKFIKTPSRKLIKIAEDLTNGGDLEFLAGIPLIDIVLQDGDSPIEVEGANVKIEFKVFQDEAQKINTKELEKALLDIGAKAATVQLVRVPRENVRSQKILELTSLRDKVCERASLNQEVVPASILEKADLLESEESDKVVQVIMT